MAVDEYTTCTTTLVIFMIDNRHFAFEEWRKAGKRFLKFVAYERERN